MKDNFYYFLYSIAKNEFVKKIVIVYYEIGIWLIRKIFKYDDNIYHSFLKGSFLTSEFIPFVSDLDFFFVGKKNEAQNKKVQRIFSVLHVFFPFINDFEFHDEKNINSLLRYGGYKYFPGKQHWRVLKGSELDFSYEFLPIKYFFDITQEIFFQFEYLFENVKKRKKGDRYRSVVIQRQFNKLKNTLNQVTFVEKGYFSYVKKFQEDSIWRDYENEEIIRLFNHYVENSFLFQLLYYYVDYLGVKPLIKNFYENDFFKKNIEIIKKGEPLKLNKRYSLSDENLKIFYLTGAIDSYIIKKIVEQNRGSFISYIFLLKYFTRLTEGYSNLKHDTNIIDEKKLENIYYQKKLSLIYSSSGDKVGTLNKTILYIRGDVTEKDILFLRKYPHLVLVNIKEGQLYESTIFNNVIHYNDSANIKKVLELILFWGCGQKKVIFIDSNNMRNDVKVKQFLDLCLESDETVFLESKFMSYAFSCTVDKILELALYRGFKKANLFFLEGQKQGHYFDEKNFVIYGKKIVNDSAEKEFLGFKDHFYKLRYKYFDKYKTLDSFYSLTSFGWVLPGFYYVNSYSEMSLNFIAETKYNSDSSAFKILSFEDEYLLIRGTIKGYDGSELVKGFFLSGHIQNEFLNTVIKENITFNIVVPLNKSALEMLKFNFEFEKDNQVEIELHELLPFNNGLTEVSTKSMKGSSSQLKFDSKGLYKIYLRSEKVERFSVQINCSIVKGYCFESRLNEIVFYHYVENSHIVYDIITSLNSNDIDTFDIILLSV